MARCIESDDIIFLCDSYTLDSRYLRESIVQAGYSCITVVLEENNFLPEGVISVYDLLTGNFGSENEKAWNPRFFNEIVVPDSWNISAGVDEPNGKITYQHEEKGRIYYVEPVRKYLVKAIDWLDRKGNVRFRDYYNRYGDICARTIFIGGEKALIKTWFSEKKREVLTENYITGDIIFNDGGLVKHFRSKLDLFSYYFVKLGFEQNRVFFNSLSTSFFLSGRLDAVIKQDILFWQEPIGENIPGNMQIILNGGAGRVDKIVVQKRNSYDKILKLDAGSEMIRRLGFIYPFEKENNHEWEALICTNSDQIEHCQELIQTFPQMHFHIAAITVMSEKLRGMGNYDNVSIYPAAKGDTLEALFKKCNYYFDINYFTEIISAVHRAFLNNQLIFAFQETVHNREYIANEHIYPISDYDRMVSDLREAMESEAVMERHLEEQRRHALSENKEAYVKMIGM